MIAQLMILFLSSGCQTYRPRPLSAEHVSNPDFKIIAVEASKIKHPLLKPLIFNLADGLSPKEAAILAVLVNPELKLARDKRRIAQSQVIQAGLLPNPQVSFSLALPHPRTNTDRQRTGTKIKSAIRSQVSKSIINAVTGKSSPDTGSSPESNSTHSHNACSLGIQWDLTSLITLNSKKASASAKANSIDLEIAWQEWQVAQAARIHVYHLVCLNEQIKLAKIMQRQLKQFSSSVNKGINAGYLTVYDNKKVRDNLEHTSKLLLTLEEQRTQEQLTLNRLMGLASNIKIPIQKNIKPIGLPANLSAGKLINGIENSRLDLLALKAGYESQEQRVRTEILNQFPKITMGFLASKDTDRIRTAGFGISFDLPIFDQNQGNITRARAKRREVFDEYLARIFEAENQIAKTIAKINTMHREISLEKKSIQRLKQLAVKYQNTLQYAGNLLKVETILLEITQKQIKLSRFREGLTDLSIALEIESGRYITPNQKVIKISSARDIKR